MLRIDIPPTQDVTVVVIDGWEIAEGSRFATKDEYLTDVQNTPRWSLTASELRRALALAADADGVVERFMPNTFYASHLSYRLALPQAGS